MNSSPPDQPVSILSAGHLQLERGNKVLLDNVHFTVSKGEIVGIIGPNGAGKTSLLSCLSGQHTDVLSKISLAGRPLRHYKAQERARHMAVLKQIPDMVFALSVREIITMGLLPYQTLFTRTTRAQKQSIVDALEQVGLSDQASKPYRSLSGGEQQRALIARSLVQKAQIYLLDEPTTFLDVRFQQQIMQLLHQLSRQQQVSVVMAIHDLNLASHYCDTLYLLNKGKLIAKGPPKKVLNPTLLSQVFQLPCRGRTDLFTHKHQVDFYPAHLADALNITDVLASSDAARGDQFPQGDGPEHG